MTGRGREDASAVAARLARPSAAAEAELAVDNDAPPLSTRS